MRFTPVGRPTTTVGAAHRSAYDARVTDLSLSSSGLLEEPAFLDLLDSEACADLRARGHVDRFRSDSMLLYEGQVDAGVVILHEGRVKITAHASSGRELVLAFRGAGSVLGELSALDRGRCSASVAAIDDVEALVVDPAEFRAFMAARPDATMALLLLLGKRLRDADRKRVEFATLDTAGRVAARILELAGRFGEAQADGSVIIALTLSQEELASWVGSSREATVKALSQLRRLGWVETGRRRICVHDLQALRQRAAA